eukprot:353338-Chlamydomonas_euryale.AAC.8
MHDVPVRVETDMEEPLMPSPVRGEGIQGGPGPPVEQHVVTSDQPAGRAIEACVAQQQQQLRVTHEERFLSDLESALYYTK